MVVGYKREKERGRERECAVATPSPPFLSLPLCFPPLCHPLPQMADMAVALARSVATPEAPFVEDRRPPKHPNLAPEAPTLLHFASSRLK